MADRKDYVITHHLRERFLQRTVKKFKHLHTCKQDSCDLCRNLVMEIRERLENRRLIDRAIAKRLNEAVECRACLNDSRFMQRYYDKYGTDNRFEFLADKDLCFVVVHDKGKKWVVTCTVAKTHTAAKQLFRPKFKKKKDHAEVLL